MSKKVNNSAFLPSAFTAFMNCEVSSNEKQTVWSTTVFQNWTDKEGNEQSTPYKLVTFNPKAAEAMKGFVKTKRPVKFIIDLKPGSVIEETYEAKDGTQKSIIKVIVNQAYQLEAKVSQDEPQDDIPV